MTQTKAQARDRSSGLGKAPWPLYCLRSNLLAACGRFASGGPLSLGFRICGSAALPWTSLLLAAAAGGFAQSTCGQPASNVVAWGAFLDIGGRGFLAPVTPPPGASNVVALSPAFTHALAVRGDGTIVAWGWNDYGETNVPAGLTNVLTVAAGPDYSLALGGRGAVAAWGGSTFSATNVPPSLTNAVALGVNGGSLNVGGEFSSALALRSDHTVSEWPVGGYGPDTPAGLTDAVAVAAGAAHRLALGAGGTVTTWGLDVLATGVTRVPASVTNVVAIAAGAYFSMALRADGVVIAWGEDYSGQTNVPPSLTNAVAIAAGSDHCLALRSDGGVVAWGYDAYGQTDTPPDLTNVVGIAAGGVCSMAITGAAMPPRQAALTNVAFGAGGFTLQVPTDRGRVYELEFKNSLSDAQWTALPLAAGTGGVLELRDPSAGPGQRFYRVRRWVSAPGLR